GHTAELFGRDDDQPFRVRVFHMGQTVVPHTVGELQQPLLVLRRHVTHKLDLRQQVLAHLQGGLEGRVASLAVDVDLVPHRAAARGVPRDRVDDLDPFAPHALDELKLLFQHAERLAGLRRARPASAGTGQRVALVGGAGGQQQESRNRYQGSSHRSPSRSLFSWYTWTSHRTPHRTPQTTAGAAGQGSIAGSAARPTTSGADSGGEARPADSDSPSPPGGPASQSHADCKATTVR